jgi:hypothetical protein
MKEDIKDSENKVLQAEKSRSSYEENLRGLLEDEHIYKYVKQNYVNEEDPDWANK